VDPDNRRPVHFDNRAASLDAAPQGFGPLKQAVTATLLRDRARAPRLYANGDYQARPSPHPAWITFSRRHEGEELIVAALVKPFDTPGMDEVVKSFARSWPQESGWSNLLRGHALDQRKHGGAALPAMVLRKSR
jgi:maltooligosyltrehalose synthase